MATKPLQFTNNGNDFFNELRSQVDAYFTTNKISKNGNWLLWSKTAFAIIVTPILLILALNAHLHWVQCNARRLSRSILFKRMGEQIVRQLLEFDG
jgi:hypothetical protein